jgi:hypothetical protein
VKVRGLSQSILAAALAIALLAAIPAAGAELAAVEVGLPQDGLFGLGGQYIIDRGSTRKTDSS